MLKRGLLSSSLRTEPGRRLRRMQQTRYQVYSWSFYFSSVCGMILCLSIHLVLGSFVFPHYSRLLYYTNLMSQVLEILHAAVKI
jgi:hypothetical protein